MCTVEEQLLVNELCAKYPELLLEIEAIENALIDYASLNSPKIKSSVKDNLMSQLNQKTTPVKKTESKVVAISNNSPKWYGFAVAASVALLVISSIINFVFYSKIEKQNTVLIVMQQEQNNYIDQLNTQKSTIDKINNEIALVTDANTKLVRLKGTTPESNARAIIYWNTNNKETYLASLELPAPPQGKQYQLWAMVDGKPIDAGVFDSTSTADRLQKMKSINNAQAFAVTLEKEGGSPTPTLTTLCLLGNV